MTIAFLSHIDFNLYLFRLPIMKALVKQGHTVYAICPNGAYSVKFADLNIQHLHYSVQRKSLNPFAALSTIFELRKLLQQIQPDILHTFTVKPNIYGNLACFGTTIEVISSITGLGSFFIEKNFKARLIKTLILILYKIAFYKVRKVIFQNNDDRQIFLNKKLLNDNQAVLIKGSGIDTQAWFSEFKLQEPFKVIFIGRLLLHKGIREFLAAAKLVKQNHPEIIFEVIGDVDLGNPYNINQEVLDHYIQSGTIEHIAWQQDIKPYLKQANIFVLPSYREGLPRTALEAMALSKPLILADAVGCRECVAVGKNGFLSPIGDHKTIAEYILKLYHNQDLLKQFSFYSRQKVVQEFDIEFIIKQHCDIYYRLKSS